MEKVVKITIIGSTGKMGQEIYRILQGDPWKKQVDPCIGVVDKSNSWETFQKAISGADVVIDFSGPEGTIKAIEAIKLEHQNRDCAVGLIIGTTGHSLEQLAEIEKAAKEIRILKTTNMSLSVNVMFQKAAEIAERLGVEWDVEIIEAHHNQKVDAPSGTAKTLAELIAQARGQDPKEVIIYGRPGLRKPGEIGISAIRAGGIIGEHTVIFVNNTERLEIKSIIGGRRDFAQGAIQAAFWITNQRAGHLYSMIDVLKG